MSKILLVGHSPNPATVGRPDLWLLPDDSGIPHAANRLLRHTGWSISDYLAIFERTNLLPDLQARPVSERRRLAENIVERVRDDSDLRSILILGAETASAFFWIHQFAEKPNKPETMSWDFVQGRAAGGPDDHPVVLQLASWLPHPSGRNQWWNSYGNRVRAHNFFQAIRSEQERLTLARSRS